MPKQLIGVWLVGARGGVSVTTLVGLAALQRGKSPTTGLVSCLPAFGSLPLVDWKELVVGGHEIRQSRLVDEAQRLHSESRVFDQATLDRSQEFLEEVEARIRPGVLWNVGSTISGLAEVSIPTESTPKATIERIQNDLQEFQQAEQLQEVVVVNLASTEPPLDPASWPETWEDAQRMILSSKCPLPASSLYAIAALELGMPYVNFTPSVGATPAGINELACSRGTCHAGRDAKTGETLLKSVLAPMFAARNLEVMSWVGHNIFGNRDGEVLADPSNKLTKVQSKDRLLEEILGYRAQTLISIEYIRSLGDWKTAWDHVHFRGFLNTPMLLQLTWQGCDSLLAAPLVLDLVRFVLVAKSQGERGALGALASFFKSPLGTQNHAFADQTSDLLEWADRMARVIEDPAS